MNYMQGRNCNYTYGIIIILMMTFFVLLLSSTDVRAYVSQIALAKDTTNSTSTTGAGKDAESLVRSIMDPSSLMSSVINETGGNSNQTSHGLAKNSTANDNGDTSKTMVNPQVL